MSDKETNNLTKSVASMTLNCDDKETNAVAKSLSSMAVNANSGEPPKKKMTVEDVLAMFEVDPIRVNIREMYPGIKCQAPHNGNMCVFDVEDENMKVVVAEDLVPCDACKKKIKHMLSARVVVRDIINGDKVRPKENNHGEDEG